MENRLKPVPKLGPRPRLGPSEKGKEIPIGSLVKIKFGPQLHIGRLGIVLWRRKGQTEGNNEVYYRVLHQFDGKKQLTYPSKWLELVV